MAITYPRLDDRDGRVLYNGLNQPAAAPRNEHVYQIVQLHHSGNSFPRGIRDKAHRSLWHTCRFSCADQYVRDRLIGMDRFAAALQNNRI